MELTFHIILHLIFWSLLQLKHFILCWTQTLLYLLFYKAMILKTLKQHNAPWKEITSTSPLFCWELQGALSMSSSAPALPLCSPRHIKNACNSAEQNLKTTTLKVIRVNLIPGAHISPWRQLSCLSLNLLGLNLPLSNCLLPLCNFPPYLPHPGHSFPENVESVSKHNSLDTVIS